MSRPHRQEQYPSSPTATSTSFPSYAAASGGAAPAHFEPYPPPRQVNYPAVAQNGGWIPPQDSNHPSYPSPDGSPVATTEHYQAPREEPPPTYPSLHHQWPLPNNFPPAFAPPPPPDAASHAISQATPAWQHHHYFPPSAAAPYPQTQERYVCPTCSKPFSRPSSLKIHTYSHTGEKPYKCKHEGCGKYFSVRSNMKRHEKGCHGDAGSGGSVTS